MLIGTSSNIIPQPLLDIEWIFFSPASPYVAVLEVGERLFGWSAWNENNVNILAAEKSSPSTDSFSCSMLLTADGVAACFLL